MKEKDVLASMSKYVHDVHSKIAIHSARNLENIVMDDTKRERESKYFGIGLVNRRSRQIALRGNVNYDKWCIIYLGSNEDDVRNIVDSMESDLTANRKMPGYLYNLEFPEPRTAVLDGTTSITPGQYTLAISGVKGIIESRISQPFIVDIEIGQYLTMQFPKVPSSKSAFDAYNVYIVDGSILKRVAQLIHIDRKNNLRGNFMSLAPESPEVVYNESDISLIPYKKIQVNDIMTEVKEKKMEDGYWCGYVLLDVHTFGIYKDVNEFLIGNIQFNVYAE